MWIGLSVETGSSFQAHEPSLRFAGYDCRRSVWMPTEQEARQAIAVRRDWDAAAIPADVGVVAATPSASVVDPCRHWVDMWNRDLTSHVRNLVLASPRRSRARIRVLSMYRACADGVQIYDERGLAYARLCSVLSAGVCAEESGLLDGSISQRGSVRCQRRAWRALQSMSEAAVAERLRSTRMTCAIREFR
jgi:hypothetical protein